MSGNSTPKHPPIHDVPDGPSPGTMPVEPDEGPVPIEEPDDPDDRGGARQASADTRN